jgi:hypothetical protein
MYTILQIGKPFLRKAEFFMESHGFYIGGLTSSEQAEYLSIADGSSELISKLLKRQIPCTYESGLLTLWGLEAHEVATVKLYVLYVRGELDNANTGKKERAAC